MKEIISNIIDNANKAAKQQVPTQQNDYLNKDGILICGKCNTPKQKRLSISKDNALFEIYNNRIVSIHCKCQQEKQKQDEIKQKQQDTNRLIERFRKQGILDVNYLKYTFDNDDNKNQSVTNMCKKYAKNFSQMYQRNKGLIFCGPVGTGKTFFACCIANEVLLQAKSILITNIPSLVSKMGFSKEEKHYILNQIANVSLLVIDDLGVERDSAYSIEKVYEIVDTRYRSGKPLIVTTNMSFKDIKNCSELSHKRIYDRITQMCYPIAVLGSSRRIDEFNGNCDFMTKFLKEN